MALGAGTRIGPYEILALLGAGGMGEVYRARDTKLERDVAIKVLPASLAGDPERLARFEREAKVLAALNHPNIAQIYGVEQGALVMELVEGEVLSGPLPVATALDYARQIADALEAAHEKGIVHRDLKPANIKITPQGVVKVLDFGLAAVAQSAGPRTDASISPTLTMAATQMGLLLGTAGYMSPEQAAGKPVDKRADIWSFGVVVWEMLTGRRLFDGETISHTLAAVLTKEVDWTQLPSATPGGVRKLLKRCLQRDLRRRLPDIGGARLELEEAMGEPAAEAPAEKAAGLPHWLAWVFGVVAVALGAVVFVHFREAPPAERVLRYTVAVPENSQIHSFAVSPDGRYVVIAASANGKQQLWLRPLDALQAQPLAFTEDATYPFWSPDSRYIGFFAQGKLKKIAGSGGPAQSLCDVPANRGASWNRDDVIVFSPGGGGAVAIQRVPAAGGVPTDVTRTKGDYRHPWFLPDGRHFLYVARQLSPEKNGIYVSSLNGDENRRVLADVSGAVFAAPAAGARIGHLLFIRENTLMAQPFDASNAQAAGDVFPVADGVSLTTNATYAPVAVSENGLLLFATGGAAGGTNQIAWLDRTGKLLAPIGSPGAVFDPSLSPDEESIAFRRQGISGADLWLRDLKRGTEQRFTTNPSPDFSPSWSPKGDRIVFASNREGQANLYQKATSGSGQDELLFNNGNNTVPSQWSRDGRFIVYQQIDLKNKLDLWVLPVASAASSAPADRKPIPFLRTEFEELFGQLSPDSRWMAYTSDKSGRREVYVRPFPPAEGEWPISIAGGGQPRWRGDGLELFFEAADGKMMAVPVKTGAPSGPGVKPSFEAGTPVALFDAHIAHATNDVLFEYDVTADGKRFLINMASTGGLASAPPLTVVVNWNAGVRK